MRKVETRLSPGRAMGHPCQTGAPQILSRLAPSFQTGNSRVMLGQGRYYVFAQVEDYDAAGTSSALFDDTYSESVMKEVNAAILLALDFDPDNVLRDM